jgi:endogenous inhibitor of DNA gyrase (YacG/DUF329 family)
MSAERPAGPVTCVYCRRRPVEQAWRPFCSDRCRLLDLARWADGSYSIPGAPQEPDKEPGPRPDESH